MSLAPPDDGSIRPSNGSLFQSGFLDTMVGGGSIADTIAAADAAFPFTYDRSGNNGNGQYTWNDNSFGNQTLNAIDASQQFPTGGFIGPITTDTGKVINAGQTIFNTPAVPVAAVGKHTDAAPAPATDNTWLWIVGFILLILLVR